MSIMDAIVDFIVTLHNTRILIPGFTEVRMDMLCFGLPVLVICAGLLTPWGDMGGEDDE